MSTSNITVEVNDKTDEVTIYVSGGDGSQARRIAEDIMDVVSGIQDDNFKGVHDERVS